MFCTNCGKEVAEGAVFCTSCGAKMTQEPAAQPESVQPAGEGSSAPVSTPTPNVQQAAPDTPKKSKTGIIAAVAAVVIIALAIILFGGGGGGYKDYKELANAYYEAIYKEDVNAMIKLYDKDAQKDLKEYKEDIKEELEEMNDDLKDTYGKNWYKKVKPGSRTKGKKSTYSVRIEIDGDFHENLNIKKDDKDRYYIDEDYHDF